MVRRLVSLSTQPSHRRFLAAARSPERAQRRVWDEILPLLRQSAEWRGRVQPRLADYAITDLDAYGPAIERSLQSGTSELNGERVFFWSQSAGTTGSRKLFPMTASFRRQFQRTVAPMIHGLLQRYPRFLAAPALYFAATDPVERSAAGAGIGFISNYNYHTIPRLLRRRYAFPPEVLRDAATFERFAPVYALSGDLSGMFAVTPISLRRLIDRMLTARDDILGLLAGDVPWDPSLPRPETPPARLRDVERALRAGRIVFPELWPSLQFICTWKTAVCAGHLREIEAHVGGIDVIDAIYSATEGWMTVPVPGVGNVVHPGAHVVEFIEGGADIASRNLLPLWALTPGKRYEVFLTTAMGFVRYRLFDVVACTGFFDRAPIIEFAHKSAGIISLGLVAVSESELVSALLGADIPLRAHWRVGPNRAGNGLVLYVDERDDSLDGQIAAADARLCEANVNYRLYTGNRTLVPLAAAALPKGHGLWASGGAHAQSKPVLLLQSCPE